MNRFESSFKKALAATPKVTAPMRTALTLARDNGVVIAGRNVSVRGGHIQVSFLTIQNLAKQGMVTISKAGGKVTARITDFGRRSI